MKLIQYLEISAPIKTVSEANRGGREGWWVRNKRKKAQQAEIVSVMQNAMIGKQLQFPLVVKITRIAPKKMDSDNLARAFKGIRDAIATKFKVDDGDDEKVKWEYDQEPIGKLKYSVKVEFISMGGPLLID